MKETNKGRRNELRDLKWEKRLKSKGLKREDPRDFICYRDQSTPCNCRICQKPKYKRTKFRYNDDND
jgi:hypothetical protein